MVLVTTEGVFITQRNLFSTSNSWVDNHSIWILSILEVIRPMTVEPLIRIEMTDKSSLPLFQQFELPDSTMAKFVSRSSTYHTICWFNLVRCNIGPSSSEIRFSPQDPKCSFRSPLENHWFVDCIDRKRKRKGWSAHIGC